MILSSLRNKSKVPLHLYIVSVDKLFTKELGKHQSLALFDIVREVSSGEELISELAHNPIPKSASAIAVVDFSLNDRDHPHSANGLEVLAQLQEHYREMELILLLKPADKSMKNTAHKMNVEHVLYKNDNFFVRFDILLKGMVNKLYLQRSERGLRLLLLIFGITAFVSLGLILIISLTEG